MADLKKEIENRRTFAIISHPDAGKTTITEKFLLYGGAIQEAGMVKGKKNSRHAVSDWMEIEKQRGISVTSSVLQFRYEGKCINILDTDVYKRQIVPTSTVYDKALRMGDDGRPWPMNDGKMPTGKAMSIKSGITSSVNTIAVQVMNMLTPQASYDFLTQRLGFEDSLVGTRTNADGTVQSDIDLAPLALGGLTDGVTVREMAGGFSTFINDGVFAGTRTYTKVLDSEGNVVLENNPGTCLLYTSRCV